MQRTIINRPMPNLPDAISHIVKDAEWYDSHCSPDARVWFADGSTPCYLKQASAGALQPEAMMIQFLHMHKMAPELLCYETFSGYDYLLTHAAQGEDGTHPSHIKHPERLAALFGESLRSLHELPTQGCPYHGLTHRIVQQASDRLTRLQSRTDMGQQELHRLEEACIYLHPRVSDTTLIHGDYCLPNIIINKWKSSTFIDVGNAGVGDRHYDLYWGLWSLHYNLHTDKYDRCFLDAYGSNLVDIDMITHIGVIEAS